MNFYFIIFTLNNISNITNLFFKQYIYIYIYIYLHIYTYIYVIFISYLYHKSIKFYISMLCSV